MWRVAMGLVVAAAAGPARGGGSSAPKTDALLRSAAEEVRVVCFGDSITGVYYHTGGYRAWPELLQVALLNAYPGTRLRVFNAGLSGHTTDAGLKRIEHDVLERKPHLVAVMFGMNDLAYGQVDDAAATRRKTHYKKNLERIVELCRSAGAEVILLTPNSVYPEAAPRRPPARLGEYAEIVRVVGKEVSVPVSDAFAEWERIRATDLRRWRLLMSETIHPSLAGHQLFAELVASAVKGEPVSLDGLSPDPRYLARTVAALKAGKAVTVVAADTVADAVRDAVRTAYPTPNVTVIPWPTAGRSLTEIEAWSKRIRGMEGRLLVVGAFSPEACRVENEESFVRQAAWVVNYALPFGARVWDVLFVSPRVLSPELTPEQREAADLLGSIVAGNDLPWIDREDVTSSETPYAIVHAWVSRELRNAK